LEIYFSCPITLQFRQVARFIGGPNRWENYRNKNRFGWFFQYIFSNSSTWGRTSYAALFLDFTAKGRKGREGKPHR
jgi:hypothetical protein